MPQFETQVKIIKEYYFEYTIEADSKEEARHILCDLYEHGNLYNDRTMEPDDMILPPSVVPAIEQPENSDEIFDICYVTETDKEEDN